MSPDKWVFYIGAFFGILFFFTKKHKKASRILLVIALAIIFCPLFLPRQFFGTWDSIKFLKNKKVNKILLGPSSPKWKINLTDSMVVISNPAQIAFITNLLKNSDMYTSGHSP